MGLILTGFAAELRIWTAFGLVLWIVGEVVVSLL